MKTFSRYCFTICLLTAAFPALALDTADNPPAAKPAALPIYWGLGFDAMSYTTNRAGILSAFPALSGSANVQSGSSNLHGFMGYRFDEFLSAQGDFIGGGSLRASDGGSTKKLFNPVLISISAVFQKPINDNFKVFGKLGGTFWSFTQRMTSDQLLKIDDGFGLSFGAGIDFNLYGGSERILRLEWNHYSMDDVLVKSANGITFAAVFNF